MVARALDVLPDDGRHAFEPKFDGYRCVAWRGERGTRLQSRQERSLTAAFPEVAEAVGVQLPAGTVVDGEIVVVSGGRIDFAALQRPESARTACLVAFDVLADAGTDLRDQPYTERRARLEQLLADTGPGMALMPMTLDRVGAGAWLTEHTDNGIEGVVAKPVGHPYLPGRRWWAKVKTRLTTEAVVGGVLGPAGAPRKLILGRHDDQGRLWVVGHTAPLSRGVAAELGPYLRPTDGPHPWPAVLPAGRFGDSAGGLTEYTQVEPTVVVEVRVDVAFEHGRWRHPVRYVRRRCDLDIVDVQRLQD
jgi:ATP-dependent DNA ligase